MGASGICEIIRRKIICHKIFHLEIIRHMIIHLEIICHSIIRRKVFDNNYSPDPFLQAIIRILLSSANGSLVYSPIVPLISTLKTVSSAGDVTEMVRSTGILPRAMDRGAPEFATSTFTPWESLVSAATTAPMFNVSAATFRSGTTVTGAIEIGPTATGFWASPDILAEIGPSPET